MKPEKVRKANSLLAGYTVSRDVTSRTVERFFSSLNCPRSLACYLLYKTGEHEQLVNLGFRAEDYQDAPSARDAYAATKYLSKADFLDLKVDRKMVALQKFLETEEANAAVNKRFKDLSLVGFDKPHFEWLLNATIRKIASVLSFDVDGDELFDSCGFGPGTTSTLKGDETGLAHKFQSNFGITRDCYNLYGPLLPVAYPLWGSWIQQSVPNFGLIEEFRERFGPCSYELGSKIGTVPKNAKTDRVTAAEPDLNIWFQKGLGRMIERRLLRSCGIDLKHQDRNQLLCFYGSMSGRLATVDFSSASDTICTAVMEKLLPPRWYSCLDSARSHFGSLDIAGHDLIIKYEMFSSMGNGFTFPLQSLIFTCVAIAVCDYLHISSDYVGVFGDDVLLPVECYDVFCEFSTFLGFSVNRQKSFSAGYFRESCGVHYFRGCDFKPLYLKKRLKSLESIYVHTNGIRRLSHRFSGDGCDNRFRSLWSYLVGRVPEKIRYIIPEGYGDGGFIGNFDEASPRTIRRKCEQVDKTGNRFLYVEGYEFLSVVQRPVVKKYCHFGLHLARIFTAGSYEGDEKLPRPLAPNLGNKENLRHRTRARISYVHATGWCNLGWWLTPPFPKVALL